MALLYKKSPAYTHGTAKQTAVLLVNLGSPDAPTAVAVRDYLQQFLTDPRVIERQGVLWSLILKRILAKRPAESAMKYAKIWTSGGAPLKIHTKKQAQLLMGYIGHAQAHATVDFAMRYGSPSIESVLDRLHADGHMRILVFPLYPQYSASTTATVIDEVCRWLLKVRNQPEVRFIRGFADHEAYIQSVASSIRRHRYENPVISNKGYRLLMSFHGMPQSNLSAGDPYYCECMKTARLIAQTIDLEEESYQVCFQSRFGREKWFEPYTADTLKKLARDGIKRVDVICPGFVADCLETLEEIAIEGKALFLEAGGKEFHYIPCLNEDDSWIRCMLSLAEIHLAGWPVLNLPDKESLAASAMRAKASGAIN